MLTENSFECTTMAKDQHNMYFVSDVPHSTSKESGVKLLVSVICPWKYKEAIGRYHYFYSCVCISVCVCRVHTWYTCTVYVVVRGMYHGLLGCIVVSVLYEISWAEPLDSVWHTLSTYCILHTPSKPMVQQACTIIEYSSTLYVRMVRKKMAAYWQLCSPELALTSSLEVSNVYGNTYWVDLWSNIERTSAF